MADKRDKRYLPAEWAPQSMVQLTWPDSSTDWADILDEVLPCYKQLCEEISAREKVLIVAADKNDVLPWLSEAKTGNIIIRECPINDTWSRDHGFITVFQNGKPMLLDFKFNGWGLKFASDKDNLINKGLFQSSLFHGNASYENHLNVVLEGGSIESDGKGTLLTTSECLFSPNRNGGWNRDQIEQYLKDVFGLRKILWVNHGFLEGDDTDSHIDTLVRLAPDNRIFYVKCTDEKDAHFKVLLSMEEELKQFSSAEGEPYRLVPLPMCSPVFNGEERLPATYANFLYINGAILVPVYSVAEDNAALDIFREEFPEVDIVGINCSPLIRQHGSLHCVTMQFPEGII